MEKSEVDIAMEELIAAWRHTPMSDVERRAYRDLFAAYVLDVAIEVIRDLSLPGFPRPDISELGRLMNSKMLALHGEEQARTLADREAKEPPTEPHHVPTLVNAIREKHYPEEIDALAKELRGK